MVGEESLLQQTARTVSGGHFQPILVVSGYKRGAFVKDQLVETDAHIPAILLEPSVHNSAAAATLALMQEGSDELMLLIPSDHVFGDREAFIAAIEAGIADADRAKFTFAPDLRGPNTQEQS